MKRLSASGFYLLFFCFLLLFPKESLSAARAGLVLWYDSLVPTLLPFLIFSQLLLKSPSADGIARFFEPLCRRLFHCSADGAFCIICGFLCGYPVGARLASLLIREKRLTVAEGQYLLSFCNNVSPMFCISYGITAAAGSAGVFPYLLIIYGSPLIFGIVTRPKQMPPVLGRTKKQTSADGNLFRLVDVCIIDSFDILLKLCGYLVVFSIVSRAFAMLLPETLPLAVPAVTALLEVTNGLSLLQKLPLGALRGALCTTALTFGGLCCVFQTNSVIEGSGLSIKKYVLHKTLTSVLSLGFFLLWLLLRSFAVNCRR